MTNDKLEKRYKFKIIEISTKDKFFELPYGEDPRIQKEIKIFEEDHSIYELINTINSINEKIYILLEKQKQIIENIEASVKDFSEDIFEWELDK